MKVPAQKSIRSGHSGESLAKLTANGDHLIAAKHRRLAAAAHALMHQQSQTAALHPAVTLRSPPYSRRLV